MSTKTGKARIPKAFDQWLGEDSDTPEALEAALAHVLGTALYRSGEPFKADSIQRCTFLQEEKVAALLQMMVERTHVILIDTSSKVQEKPTYVPFSAAKQLALRTPWRRVDPQLPPFTSVEDSTAPSEWPYLRQYRQRARPEHDDRAPLLACAR